MKLSDDRRRAMFARMGVCCPRKKNGWEEKAIKKFGTTEDFNRVGWILPDGRMLDFTLVGGGQVGHDRIGLVDGRTRGDAAIRKYVDKGALRFALGFSSIYLEHSLDRELTPAQKKRVKEAIKKHPVDALDIDKVGAGGIASKRIPSPDSSISLRRLPPLHVRTTKLLDVGFVRRVLGAADVSPAKDLFLMDAKDLVSEFIGDEEVAFDFEREGYLAKMRDRYGEHPQILVAVDKHFGKNTTDPNEEVVISVLHEVAHLRGIEEEGAAESWAHREYEKALNKIGRK